MFPFLAFSMLQVPESEVCWSTCSQEKKQSVLMVASVNCPGVNPPTMADFKLPVGSGNITKYLTICVANKSGLQLAFHCTELTSTAPLVEWMKWLPGFCLDHGCQELYVLRGFGCP